MATDTKHDLKILTVIPARGGSKGIVRKNISLVGGKPLIAWTIEAAKNSTADGRVIVSTDDEEIANVAKAFGAEVPFLRPKHLATDDSPVIDTLNFLLDTLDESFTHILQLNPTSPLRTEKHINDLLRKFDPSLHDSMVSVCPPHHHPNWCKTINEEGKLSDFMEKGPDQFKMRQSLPKVYALNGAMYLVNSELVKKGTYYSDKTHAYIMETADSLDIDEPWEMYLVNLILRDRNDGI